MQNVILRGVVGSTAYGLATPDSDVDRLGVFQAPTVSFLGLTKPKETYVQTKPHPDMQHHELKKFVMLCLAANPTVMELLWLDEYEILSPVGEGLVAHRNGFLSNRIRNTYGGYAKSQLKRLKDRGDGSFSSDLRKRIEKHARHCFRLIIQGQNALRTGQLRIRLTEREALAARLAGELAANDVDAFEESFNEALANFDATNSVLPDKPDEDGIGEWLTIMRLNDLTLSSQTSGVFEELIDNPNEGEG